MQNQVAIGPPVVRSGPRRRRSESRLLRSCLHVRTLRADLPQPIVAAQPRQAAPGPHPVSALPGRVRVGADAAPPPAQYPRPVGAAGVRPGAGRGPRPTRPARAGRAAAAAGTSGVSPGRADGVSADWASDVSAGGQCQC